MSISVEQILNKLRVSDLEKQAEALQELREKQDQNLYNNILDWNSFLNKDGRKIDYTIGWNDKYHKKERNYLDDYIVLALASDAPPECKSAKEFLNSITKLKVYDAFPPFFNPDFLSNITSLKISAIDANNNQYIADFSFVKSFVNLERLEISGANRDVYSLFKNPHQIKTLKIENDTTVKNLSFLTDFKNIEELSLENCNNLSDLSVLNELRQLKKITFRNCSELNDVTPLQDMVWLEKLDFAETKQLKLNALKKVKSSIPWCEIIAPSWNSVEFKPKTTIKKAKTKDDKKEVNELLKLLQEGKQNEDEVFSKLETIGKAYYYELLLDNAVDYWEYQLEKSDNLDINHRNPFGFFNTITYRLLAQAPYESKRLTDIKQKIRELRGAEIKNNSIGDMPNLETLSTEVDNDTSLENLSKFKELKELNLSFNGKDFTGLTAIKRLKNLTLSNCRNLTDLSFVKSLPEIEKLHLQGSNGIEDFSSLIGANLKQFSYKDCSNVKEISALPKLSTIITYLGIGNNEEDVTPISELTDLKEIYISQNRHIEQLPDMSALTQLEKITIRNCSTIRDISALGSVPSLKEIYLIYCDFIDDISSLQNLSKLKILDLSGCTKIELNAAKKIKTIFPECSILSPKGYQVTPNRVTANQKATTISSNEKKKQFSEIKNLITSTKKEQIEQGLGILEKLKYLEFFDELLKGIDESVLYDRDKLKTLNFYQEKLVNKYFSSSNIKQRTALQVLLKAPPETEIFNLKNKIEAIINLDHLPDDLETINNLEKLSFSWLMSKKEKYFTDLIPISKVISLKYLEIDKNVELNNLSGLQKLTNLESISISKCRNVTELEPIHGLPKLHTLDVSETGVRSMKLTNFPALRKLNISSCKQLEELELNTFDNKELLSIFKTDNRDENIVPSSIGLKNLSGLRPLLSLLNDVIIKYFQRLIDISALEGIESIESITFVGCNSIKDFSPLKQLPNLKFFQVRMETYSIKKDNMTSIPDFSFLSDIERLKEIKIEGFKGKVELSFLANCKNLKHMSLARCIEIDDITNLSGLDQLESLDLSYCLSIKNLSPLSTLSYLRHLDLSMDRKTDLVRDLSVLKNLTQLEELNLKSCNSLSDLSILTELKNLKVLDISNCKNITDLTPLENLENLTKLILKGCDGLDYDKAKKLSAKLPKCRIKIPSGRAEL